MNLKKKLNHLLAGSVQRVLDASYMVYRDQVVFINSSHVCLSVDEFGALVAEKLRKGDK